MLLTIYFFHRLTSSSHLDGEDLSDAALKAKERAAQLAAKLAAQGKLSSAPAPPPLVVCILFIILTLFRLGRSGGKMPP